MTSGTDIHRTTIEIDLDALREARVLLGTSGYKETVNEALRAVSRADRLRRGAALIRSGELELTTPAELAEQRRPRVD